MPTNPSKPSGPLSPPASLNKTIKIIEKDDRVVRACVLFNKWTKSCSI